MKKRIGIFLSVFILFSAFAIMLGMEKIYTISIDETKLDVKELAENQFIPISWVSVRSKYEPEKYNEISAARYLWSLDGKIISNPELYQNSLIYKNDILAWIAFYQISPYRVFKHDWPNFSYGDGVYSKETDFNFNANRYRFYCGIGGKDACQVWYYWAQYENILVGLRLFSIGVPSSLEEFGNFVKEFDTQLSNVVNN